jgi:hypothetical protein
MTKQKILYLILAIACFIGIILIFVFDGYMGLYDSLTATSGEQTQTITYEQWSDETRFGMSYVYPSGADNLFYSYQVDNRRFSKYQADVRVSVWKNQVKVKDVLTQGITVNAFGKETVNWDISSQDFASGNSSLESQYTLQIERGDVVRKIIIYVPPNVIKVIPPPSAAAQ